MKKAQKDQPESRDNVMWWVLWETYCQSRKEEKKAAQPAAATVAKAA